MICRTCLRRAATALPQRSLPRRQFSTTFRASYSAAAAAAPAASPAAASEAKAPLSTCVPGTTMNGLNYFKDRTDPLALEDKEYPEWLWQCLEITQKKDDEAGGLAGGDEWSKSKKQRRLAAKAQRKLEADMLASGDLSALAPKIPLQKQTINLPDATDGSVASAVEAAEAREALRKAMRKDRKAGIKESNFLKSM